MEDDMHTTKPFRPVRSIVKGAGMVTLLAMLTSPVYANDVKKLEVWGESGFNYAPIITVYSTDGVHYNRVDATKVIRASVKAVMQCKFGSLKPDKVYEAKLQIGGDGFVSIGKQDPADGYTLHAIGKNGGNVSRQITFQGNSKDAGKWAGACNAEVDKWLSEHPGKTRSHIMATGFTVDRPAALNGYLTFYCHPLVKGGFEGMDYKSTPINARVACKASAIAKQKLAEWKKEQEEAKKPPLKKVAFVKPVARKVKLVAYPKEHFGACPVKIRFRGGISPRKLGSVKYRFVNNKGVASGWYSMVFKNMNLIAMRGAKSTIEWNTVVTRPDTKNSLSIDSKTKPFEKYGHYTLEVKDTKTGIIQKSRADYHVICKKPKKAIIGKIKAGN